MSTAETASIELTEIEQLSSKIASNYKRRVWHVDEEELRQILWVEMLSALPKYSPEKGELRGYLYRTGVNAAHRAVLYASAPVTAKHRPKVLRGLTRCEVKPDEHVSSERQDSVYEAERLSTKVRTRVRALVGNGAPFAFSIFTGEHTPAEISGYHKVPVTSVYELRRKIREVLIKDVELRKLWEEL